MNRPGASNVRCPSSHTVFRSTRSRCAVLAPLAVLTVLFAGACAHLPRSPRSPATGSFVPVAVQHLVPVGPESAVGVMEVYLVNTGTTTRTYTAVMLNDRPLRAVRTDAMTGATVELEGRHVRLEPDPAADPDVAWWQFYPGAQVPPGQTTVLTVCFRRQIPLPARLTVLDAAGENLEVPIPRRQFGASARITAVTFARDLSHVYVQCDAADRQPVALWLNGWAASPMHRLTGANPRVPVLLCVQTPFPLATGMPLDVRVQFDDGTQRRALVRAFGGISLDAAGDRSTGIARLRDLKLDATPPVLLIPFDAVCADFGARQPGIAAWNVVSERQRLWRRRPDRLAGFGFCTAFTPDSWNIYGPIADAVYAKPYRLGWGRDASRIPSLQRRKRAVRHLQQ